MRWVLGAIVAGLMVAAGPALAQSAAPSSVAEQAASAETIESPAPASEQAAPVAIPHGTVVIIEVLERLSSETSRRGDTFAIRLAEPVVSKGQLILQAGAPGLGDVVDGRPAGVNGRPGVLVVSARYIEVEGTRLPLISSEVLGGQSTVLRFPTLEPHVGFGGAIEIPAGSRTEAFIGGGATTESGTPRPTNRFGELPEGYGHVVFFRPNRNTAGFYTYSVREGDEDIARLPNGTFAVASIPAGLHEFSIGGAFPFGRPRSTLRFEIIAGQTYYVEHGIEFLAPSNPAVFDSQRPRLDQVLSEAQRD